MKYRLELDGIRAIAVLAVLLYHIDSYALPGGFLGVDVFFVLSGFLITTILCHQAERGVSLKYFFAKRIRRILPPLAGAIAFTFLLGAAFFLRADRTLLLEHAAAAFLSVSNVFIWFETAGYWAVSSTALPLLHTWSLSVEEQFYLFFPLILKALYSWNRRRVLPSLIVLALCSLLSAWLNADSPLATFLILPFRAWEILLGAILAIALRDGKLPEPSSISVHSLVQGLMFVALFYTFTSTTVVDDYAGWIPLLTCVATTTLIYSLGCVTIFHKILAHPILVYIGKRSYSLYLYHWPIIVFLKLYTPQVSVFLVTVLSFACAELSYQWIEKPFRFQLQPFRSVRNWLTVSLLPLSALVLVLFSHPFAVSRSLDTLSLPEVGDRGVQYDYLPMQDERITNPLSWNWDESARPQVLLVGSSHAISLVGGLADYCKERNLSLVSLARSSKGLVEDSEENRARIEFARSHSPYIIILFSHWTREVEVLGLLRYQEVLKDWSQLCDQLILLDSPPQIDIPRDVAPSLHHYLVHLDMTGQAVEVDVFPRDVSELEGYVKSLPNVTWLSLMPLFSENGKCSFLPNGVFPYADSFHINPYGVQFLLEESLGEVLQQRVEDIGVEEGGSRTF